MQNDQNNQLVEQFKPFSPKLTIVDQLRKLGFPGEQHVYAGTPSRPALHHTFFSRDGEISGWVA